ncbi:Acetyltransferase (GNAT) domain-containing protein [Flagellimonas taeanensis]|jgi:hypothetical protein|uniref:Acetyltransferase (GNAT) domain-containing protein n=1 Tax=Flagellimonas taeanensis TaxID=1005926 RepID=A0A1M6V1Q3_9FLAO|nr:GNAT family N-acetyltransferase [Allomuricauda taeanensis]SFC21372.1 Acetyltransferase (GNAT) domain-containing protein [Allomuricauda taeanensis]SHK75370.1 Acetyltransferase (GNAT) domain-containing protein [Allomuricauda taeanensis]
MDFKLEVLNLDDKDGLHTYTNLIKEEWDNNPYYLYDYFRHHRNGTNRLIAFNFTVGGKSTVVMPMVVREIEMTEEPLLDVISPYGYSGPLFKKNTAQQVIETFWSTVDDWYKKNRIVTEFVRFHLNGNHQHYSGTILPTLDNVYGTLMDTFDAQWESFLPKVRNNYRKAAKADLTMGFFSNDHITKEHVSDFYHIYVSTMVRNEASKAMFFSLEHFENLILNHTESFSLVFVYTNGIPVSTELIIHLDDCIYGYLGGTLSEYFNYRPNDFLRVEVIRWGIERGDKHYILGGGITNGDGLYKFKKSLFPNSSDRIFFTGRKIVDVDGYDRLSVLSSTTSEEIGSLPFFPMYRKGSI